MLAGTSWWIGNGPVWATTFLLYKLASLRKEGVENMLLFNEVEGKWRASWIEDVGSEL